MASNDRRAFVEARGLRHDYGLTPLSPADPFAMAAWRKIEIVRVPLGEHDVVEGGFLRRDGRGFIMLNSSKWGRRSRFTCAHELGHATLLEDVPDVEFLDTADQLELAKSANADEREANLFAAELLMPEVGVHQLVAGHSPEDAVGAVARTYLVSPKSAAIRLNECGVIDAPTTAALIEVIDTDWQSFWREQQIPKDAKGTGELLLPDRFRALADRLHEASVILDERHDELVTRPVAGRP